MLVELVTRIVRSNLKLMLNTGFSDYSAAQILVRETITITGAETDQHQVY